MNYHGAKNSTKIYYTYGSRSLVHFPISLCGDAETAKLPLIPVLNHGAEDSGMRRAGFVFAIEREMQERMWRLPICSQLEYSLQKLMGYFNQSMVSSVAVSLSCLQVPSAYCVCICNHVSKGILVLFYGL